MICCRFSHFLLHFGSSRSGDGGGYGALCFLQIDILKDWCRFSLALLVSFICSADLVFLSNTGVLIQLLLQLHSNMSVLKMAPFGSVGKRSKNEGNDEAVILFSVL